MGIKNLNSESFTSRKAESWRFGAALPVSLLVIRYERSPSQQYARVWCSCSKGFSVDDRLSALSRESTTEVDVAILLFPDHGHRFSEGGFRSCGRHLPGV